MPDMTDLATLKERLQEYASNGTGILPARRVCAEALAAIPALEARLAVPVEDNDLIMRLLRERRWHNEGILDGTREAPKRKRGKGRKRQSGFRRIELARVNAEIARRLPQFPALDRPPGVR